MSVRFAATIDRYEDEGLSGLADKRLEQISHRRAPGKGKHRKRAPLPGMMLHQDASTHPRVADVYWDLIVTMDDATGEHYSMFLVEEEGTASSFRGVQETIAAHGLFCSLYTDRGSHYWHTPEAGGKVDKRQRTQFGRAMEYLGIEMIPAYSPEARGRSERAFATHQGRLPRERTALELSPRQGPGSPLLPDSLTR